MFVKCLSCQYPLWGIAARVCPECGAPSAPSRFRFRPGSVRFCCPHCDQGYYGTDADGLLVPREFDCVSCGQHVTLDEMIVRPVPGGEAVQMPLNLNPWDDRANVGRWRAFWRTMFLGIGDVGQLMRVTRPEGSNGLRFVATLWGVVVMIAFLPLGLIMVPAFIAGLTGGARTFGVPLMIAAAMLITSTIVLILATVLAAAASHGVLRLTGPTAFPLKRTVQAFSYTCGPMIFCAFPCLGFYWTPVGLLWWTIMAGVALAHAQRVSGWRAFVAIFCPAFTFALLVFGISWWNNH